MLGRKNFLALTSVKGVVAPKAQETRPDPGPVTSTPLPFVCNDLNGGPALSVATRSRRETVERLERLERAQALLEQLEPDFETGHSKIQDLPLTTSNTAALHQATEK